MNILKSITIVGALLFFSSATIANEYTSGTGTVAETMDSAGYTYVRLEENGRWIAGKQLEVSPGEKIKYENAVEMGEFHSRSLDRTFEKIAFTQLLELVNPRIRGDHADSEAMAMVGEQLGITKSTAPVTLEAGEVTPLNGGKTIDTIWKEHQQLTGQQVTLRAKVMKVNQNILGKNWITLQDGTGTAPENKLLTTSAELVEIGDLVTVKGIVKTDVDLGSGYKYKVVLEEATFSR